MIYRKRKYKNNSDIDNSNNKYININNKCNNNI